MPSSPRTPTRRRKSSATSVNVSSPSSTPQSNGFFWKKGSTSRRSSQYSIPSPGVPRSSSYHEYVDEFGLSNGLGNGVATDIPSGLGNLADELAEVYDEDQHEDLSEDEPEANGANGMQEGNGTTESRYSGLKAALSSRECSSSPPRKPARTKHRRRQSSLYGGSDFSDDRDLDGAEGILPALEARMDIIEHLARRGINSGDSEVDGVVHRVVSQLKDLASQANLENGTSRLITTHTALTSHLTNQTRTLATLLHSFMSPFGPLPDFEAIQNVLPLLASLITDLPAPTTQALSSLHSLHTSTTDLTTSLTYLSDSLHMARQTTSLTSRRLRSATEMVVEMRREADARDEAVKWLNKGNWEKRLAGRECARVCGDVMGGFEETCNTWRERLLGDLEVGAA